MLVDSLPLSSILKNSRPSFVSKNGRISFHVLSFLVPSAYFIPETFLLFHPLVRKRISFSRFFKLQMRGREKLDSLCILKLYLVEIIHLERIRNVSITEELYIDRLTLFEKVFQKDNLRLKNYRKFL